MIIGLNLKSKALPQLLKPYADEISCNNFVFTIFHYGNSYHKNWKL